MASTTTATGHLATTTAGAISGLESDGVFVFKGVPFAAPPVGDRRFRAPLPPDRWDGVRPCLAPGSACAQDASSALLVEGGRYLVPEAKSEDCLYLNLWTPALDDGARPVIVWIHGGGYFSGSGSVPVYDGTQFAKHGTVLVSINYRPGLFGFCHLAGLAPGYEGSGNAGILDQVRALEWVQENVAGFGGDPGNVTIMGSSAGGGPVLSLMAMPMARGLFRRAIPMSCGGAGGNDTTAAEATTERTFARLGVPYGDVDALLRLSTEELVIPGHREFRPVIDGTTIPRLPQEAIADGYAKDIDLIRGYTADELGGRRAPVQVTDLQALLREVPMPPPDPNAELDVMAFFPGTSRSLDEIRSIYRASLEEAGRPAEDLDVFQAARCDTMMVRPSIRFAEAQSRHNANTYVYRFSWPSPIFDGLLGAFHGIPAPFYFDSIGRDPSWAAVLGDSPPQQLADAMHTAFVRFAETGDPNHPGLPHWPGYDGTRRAVLDFDTPCTVIDDPDRERRLLFEEAEPRDQRSQAMNALARTGSGRGLRFC